MKPLSPLRKGCYIVLGSIFFLLGGMGLFLPVLPTTPFWLLTAWFYLRSSQRLYNRVMAFPLFGSIVRNFQLYRAIPLRAKIFSISLLWTSVLVSALIVGKIWLVLLLTAVSIGVSIHILSYPTLSRKQTEHPE